ncbi:TonB-dependent receptor domain-containing protein [Acinetobacter larvae]|uniref:TonB-dependent receptor n=1 Tax=Acinetobacter larvae TaxID=1789224 RepID=A0A1B2LX68_9GAMM|nr:TonB-dependent receptor [Acinetobacter larvae]AOA57530.1 TonB-dependent receptor [Acinetobacter larvae]
MSISYKRSLLSVAVMGLMINVVQAAQTTVDQDKEDIKQLETIVISASGQAVDVREAPASISVITAEEIEKRPVASLADVLKRIPGVTGGLSTNGDGSKIKLRGLPDNYTLVLIDGKRIGSSRDTNYRPDLGRQDLDWITPDMIERIEVVRGPMSSLYGSDAMGGVINIITKKINTEWGGSATYNYTQPTTSGNLGRTFQAGVAVSGPLADHVGLRLNASQTRRESDNNFTSYSAGRGGSADLNQVNGTPGYIKNNFGMQLNFQPTPNHDIALEANYGVEKNLQSKGITNVNAATGVESSTDATTSWGPEKLERQGYSISWDGRWANDISSKLTGYYNDYDQSVGDSIAKSNESIAEGQINIPFKLGVPNQLVIGGQWKREELNNSSTLGTVIKDKDGNVVPSYDGSTYAGKSKLTGDSWALFIEDTLELHEKVKLTLGNRYDHDEKFGDHNSPRAYLVVLPTDDWAIKGGISKGFRAPTIKEGTAGAATGSRGNGCNSLVGSEWYDQADGKWKKYETGGCYMAGNPDLKPEKSTNYEIGVNYTGFGSDINLTYFYTDFTNKIDYEPWGVYHNTWWTQMKNIQKARTEGLEFSAAIPFGDRLKWTNSATYFIKSKNLDTGEALINTPELTVSSSLDFRVTDPWTVNLVADYVGKQYTTNITDDKTLQKAHTIFGLSTNYVVSNDVTVRAGINNLFNKQMARSTQSYYVEGQSAFVGMTYKF